MLLFQSLCSWNISNVQLVSQEPWRLRVNERRGLEFVSGIQRIGWLPGGGKLDALWISLSDVFCYELVVRLVRESDMQTPRLRPLNVEVRQVPLRLGQGRVPRAVQFGLRP